MRAIVVSRTYADPATRGKLKALAGLGVSVAAAVPDRWSPVGLGAEQQTVWGDEGGVRTVPIAIKGDTAPGADPAWNRGALRQLFTDFRPELIQIEEEPWTRAAAMTAALARRLRVPYVVLTRESIAEGHGTLGRLRRKRVLGGARGILAVNELAEKLAVRQHPRLPHQVIPQLGVGLPLQTAQREPAGLTIGFLGRLMPEKGLDLLFRSCVKLVGRWTITVVGTGPAQEELEGLAERLGIAGRVTWLGALPRQARGRGVAAAGLPGAAVAYGATVGRGGASGRDGGDGERRACHRQRGGRASRGGRARGHHRARGGRGGDRRGTAAPPRRAVRAAAARGRGSETRDERLHRRRDRGKDPRILAVLG